MTLTTTVRTTNSMRTARVRSTKGITVSEKHSFMHLREATKVRVKEVTGQLVGSRRLESKDELDERLSALRQAGLHLRRALKRP